MKSEDLPEELDLPMFSSHEKLAEIERQLYGHVVDAVDLDALDNLDQFLYELIRKRNIGHDLAVDIASALIARSLHRVADEQLGMRATSIPFEITEAERRAVAFEASCPFCNFERKLAEQAKRDAALRASSADDDECCPLCDDMAAEWREKHAEALAKAGLWPPEPEHKHKHGIKNGMPS